MLPPSPRLRRTGDAGCGMLDAGCWILDAGYWMLDAGCFRLRRGYGGRGMLDAERWMQAGERTRGDPPACPEECEPHWPIRRAV